MQTLFWLDGLFWWSHPCGDRKPSLPSRGKRQALAAGRKGLSVTPRCPALCGPSVGDNELSVQAASLPFECGEEMRQDDIESMKAEVPVTPPELTRWSGRKKGQRRGTREMSKGAD
ncbi:hypothetical protein PBY51_018701 [Eleginops maclovinus]|uniref:Uncharacterized protein n=1 Tax=Eleginops maclovinus TaxID=56733 RepID=A0AAN7Y8T5_ELEMC|nr:hypothetical protein PBY51_018701 [Eleginops maclovinus]